MKHTPGPWKIRELTSGNFLIEVDERKEPIAGVSGFYEGIFNANLIAAAPELLEALKVLVNASYESVNKDRYAPYHVEELYQANVAIAKAEGVKP